jgi:Protein SET DOMAIN GROUP 2 C-terminal
MIGWFKQTVDKPNASLSADRRGTLSMPDLESFIVSQKNQDSQKGHKKKKKKGEETEGEENAMDLNGKAGTKSRPKKSVRRFHN